MWKVRSCPQAVPRTLNGATTARAASTKAQTVDLFIVEVTGGM
jgi:hypothetical protein